jgi:hypothetical protein
MPSTDDVKININQNLWGLLLGLGALGASEYFNLHTLYWLSSVIAVVMMLSMVFTVTFYTIHYCKRKRKDWK